MVYALTVQSLSFLLALDGPAMNSLDVEEVSPPEPGNGNTTMTVLSLCVGLQSRAAECLSSLKKRPYSHQHSTLHPQFVITLSCCHRGAL